MRHFRNELNGLAAKCNFGTKPEGLVKDVFIVNMINKVVQQEMCTEQKASVADNIQFAIAFEERIIRQQSFENNMQPHIKAETKDVKNINNSAKRWDLAKSASAVRDNSAHNT